MVVYDLKSQKAHSLNESAAKVWELCDGNTTIGDLAAQMDRRASGPASEEIVWLALDQLEKADLLLGRVPERAARGVSRRKLIQRLVYAAVAVPVVSSMIVPVASAAASGICGTAACFPCSGVPPVGTPLCFNISGGQDCTATNNAGCTACLGNCSYKGPPSCTQPYDRINVTCDQCKNDLFTGAGCNLKNNPLGCSCQPGQGFNSRRCAHQSRRQDRQSRRGWKQRDRGSGGPLRRGGEKFLRSKCLLAGHFCQ